MKPISKPAVDPAAAVRVRPAATVASGPQFSAFLQEQSRPARQGNALSQARGAADPSPDPSPGLARPKRQVGEAVSTEGCAKNAETETKVQAAASSANEVAGGPRPHPDTAVAPGCVSVAPPTPVVVCVSTGGTDLGHADLTVSGSASPEEPLRLLPEPGVNLETGAATTPVGAPTLGILAQPGPAGCPAEAGGITSPQAVSGLRAAASCAVSVLEQAHNPVLQAVATALQRVRIGRQTGAVSSAPSPVFAVRRFPNGPVAGASPAPGAVQAPSSLPSLATAAGPKSLPVPQAFAECLVTQATGAQVVPPVQPETAGPKAEAGVATATSDTPAKGTSPTVWDATGAPLGVPQGASAPVAIVPLSASPLMDAPGTQAPGAFVPAAAPAAARAESAGRPVTQLSSQERVSTPPAPQDAALALGSVRLAQGAGRAEMQIGMHSPEFGAISIRTTSTQSHVSADVSVEHAELSKVMNDHLPEVQGRLAADRPMEVRIHQATATSGSGGGQGFGDGSRGGARSGHRQQPTTVRAVARGPTPSGLGVPQMSGASGSELRLDVRV